MAGIWLVEMRWEIRGWRREVGRGVGSGVGMRICGCGGCGCGCCCVDMVVDGGGCDEVEEVEVDFDRLGKTGFRVDVGWMGVGSGCFGPVVGLSEVYMFSVKCRILYECVNLGR